MLIQIFTHYQRLLVVHIFTYFANGGTTTPLITHENMMGQEEKKTFMQNSAHFTELHSFFYHNICCLIN